MARNAHSAERRRDLSAQVAAEGAELCSKYGPGLAWDGLLSLLQDRAFVRFPCELRFDSEPLLPGEFAHASLKGARPEDG
ncbi:MAG TPA: hypothetical protein VHI52_00580, partial [Verrucomicrobiae bacterium]|nr:hypothetical protein [Verrucomicrobiae bacterium]